jgi:four helix bundle protein
LGRQVLRSGSSVGAHYREASRGRSNAEFIAKIGDCLKELDETGYWLELISEAGLLKPKRVEAFLAETDELLAIFTTIAKNAGKRR